ncbi:exodeoxyribonuclease III [Ensifer sp.]|jgi:exodeoxyribonuclease-3|uniref:exodeoxyribonuclease III n=1 Tax=Ensifer sp. TaxID=1872086 RepID=UPI002E0FF056|nr:exodeoxyribonuclease III [Ensifer sp.]
MRIATFNINGVVRRLENLTAWLGESKPDIVCLQELKATDAEFPHKAIEAAGYGAVWHGQSAWNGVAILARGGQPVLTRVGLEGDPSDKQSRYIEAAVSGVLVACLYAPNGNPQPGPKFDYKRAWHDRLFRHASDLAHADLPVVLAGDYNIVPEPRDIYPTRSYDDNALVQPESRAAFRKLLGHGWLDALRAIHPQQQLFTFWDYRRNRWQRDAGLRLDHILLSRVLADELTDAGIDRDVRGMEGASDHAPVWITLRD